jgi:hypothetical protein
MLTYMHWLPCSRGVEQQILRFRHVLAAMHSAPFLPGCSIHLQAITMPRGWLCMHVRTCQVKQRQCSRLITSGASWPPPAASCMKDIAEMTTNRQSLGSLLLLLCSLCLCLAIVAPALSRLLFPLCVGVERSRVLIHATKCLLSPYNS